jgi:hypothetical protein
MDIEESDELLIQLEGKLKQLHHENDEPTTVEQVNSPASPTKNLTREPADNTGVTDQSDKSRVDRASPTGSSGRRSPKRKLGLDIGRCRNGAIDSSDPVFNGNNGLSNVTNVAVATAAATRSLLSPPVSSEDTDALEARLRSTTMGPAEPSSVPTVSAATTTTAATTTATTVPTESSAELSPIITLHAPKKRRIDPTLTTTATTNTHSNTSAPSPQYGGISDGILAAALVARRELPLTPGNIPDSQRSPFQHSVSYLLSSVNATHRSSTVLSPNPSVFGATPPLNQRPSTPTPMVNVFSRPTPNLIPPMIALREPASTLHQLP